MIRRGRFYFPLNTELEIFVIGYKTMGESILIRIGQEFAGVIDCFKRGATFKTKDLIDQLCIKNLDFLCWTHTDWDHTFGLTELFPYFNDKTAFIMPEGISHREITHTLSTGKRKDKYYAQIFEGISNEYESRANYFISANQHVRVYSFEMVSKTTGNQYQFEMDAFSPLSMITKTTSLQTIADVVNHSKRKSENPNLFSVGISIGISSQSGGDPISICLTADLDNFTLERMDSEEKTALFQNNVILKIPHHTSKNSDSLLGYISTFEHAVTTCYKRGRSRLPDITLLKKYAKSGTVSRTEKIDDKKYGVVHYRIPIDNFRFGSVKCSYEGDAGII